MFLPTKAGRILLSTFEANKKQDWKIKNGKKKEECKYKTLSQINKAQWHQLLERFPSLPQHSEKVAYQFCRQMQTFS